MDDCFECKDIREGLKKAGEPVDELTLFMTHDWHHKNREVRD